MSKASREWKNRQKNINELLCSNNLVTHRKEMTLRSYRKWRRYIGAYAKGMKQHDKYVKGLLRNGLYRIKESLHDGA